MPIRKVSGGYKWGSQGKVYKSRKGAERQAAAAHANGFTGKKEGGSIEEANKKRTTSKTSPKKPSSKRPKIS